MSFKQQLSEKTDIPENKLSSSYQIIGQVLLLKLPKLNKKEKQTSARAIMETHPHVKTVCEIIQIKGKARTPHVVKLRGNGTETIHKEHGIKYKLDVKKIMFSKGNLYERKRVTRLANKNEIIVDMFAGIGYFSLGLSKQAKKVYAIEKNKTAYDYLKQNIALNNIDNIEPINNDCRNTTLPNIADRVIMGYFPGTEKFLPKALQFLKQKGTIHYHNTYSKDQLWSKPLHELENAIKNTDYQIKYIDKIKVKTAGPCIYHVVLDTYVKKKSGRINTSSIS